MASVNVTLLSKSHIDKSRKGHWVCIGISKCLGMIRKYWLNNLWSPKPSKRVLAYKALKQNRPWYLSSFKANHLMALDYMHWNLIYRRFSYQYQTNDTLAHYCMLATFIIDRLRYNFPAEKNSWTWRIVAMLRLKEIK